jgi:putative (di)nucleoside polyphosphate hydrolase
MTAGDLTAGGLTADAIAALPYRENVGVMLLNAAGKVFVGQRLDNRTPAWQMPQGGIDPGESPEEAALRELEEETGVSRDLVQIEAENEGWLAYDLPLDLLDKLWGGQYRGQEQKWFRMRFLGSDDQVNIETDHPEFAEWKWIDQSEMVDAIVPFKRDVYIAVLGQIGTAKP